MLDLEKIQESPNLLDILVQMEDVLDQMDIYVFDNWLKGQVVEGPVVRRYWLNMTLLYAEDSMPDPKGAERLLKHDIRVDYRKGVVTNASMKDFEEGKELDEDDEVVWLVKVSIPRRLVVQIDAAHHDFYDEEVDVDDVEDAKDSGLDNESPYTDDRKEIF